LTPGTGGRNISAGACLTGRLVPRPDGMDLPPMPMSRRRILFAAALLAAIAWPADAFIERLTPLKNVIDDSDAIFVATVDRLDPARPAAVLKVGRDLKGKAGAERLPVNLAGDKEGHSPKLLERLAEGLPVVVFATDLGKKRIALAYSDGTWFQLVGQPDGKDVRWAFTHCEVYLRRTFKGSTAELETTVADALAGKKAPPKPDPKEPPGLGPIIKK